MTNLKTKNILLGITGGIAAYKSAELLRLLIKQGYSVRVCMTSAATQFITPLTLQALSGNAVHTDLLDTQAEAAMGHIELAKWADDIIIAPTSADFIAKLANGFADDLLSTVCLASSAPIAIAPAMNQQMWKNAAVQHNVKQLIDRNIKLLGPASGEQACGDTGLGRMLEPTEIIAQLYSVNSPLFQDTNILITAGATRESIDPVRFITNRSSGRMGYSIAKVARDMGANVTLVSGIVNIEPPTGVQSVTAISAQAMYKVTMSLAKNTDIFIATAAVADYSPKQVHQQKIKKTADQLVIELRKNPDILAELSHQFPQIFTVGFAAETDDLLNYAHQKLHKKKLDMIAANWVGENKGFDQAENALEVLWQGGQQSLPKMNKHLLARELLEIIATRFKQSHKDSQ